MLDGDERAIRMVYSLAFSLPGPPVLFYGEEIGMGENLGVEGRMSVRTPMQWSAERNGGFSTVEDPAALRRPPAGGRFGFEHVNVAAQRRDPDSLLNWFERLIRRRRECPELGFGTLEVLEAGAPSVLAHRCDWDGSTVVAVHELAGRPAEVRLALDEGEALVDLFEETEHPLPATLELGPYAARWFRVRRAGRRLPP
jgi:maltose alpha-D-glucosyltransferase/alpha-amylase